MVPRQDQRPCLGRLLPSHRKACPAPSSGRARGLSPGGPQTSTTSRGRSSGTTWRRASQNVSLMKAHGVESPTFRNSSLRPLRSFRKQEPYAAIAIFLAWLPIQARMVGYMSTLMSQGSTEPHLRSASGLRAWDVARVRRTAMFTCLSACRTRLLPTSAICGAFLQLRRPGMRT